MRSCLLKTGKKLGKNPPFCRIKETESKKAIKVSKMADKEKSKLDRRFQMHMPVNHDIQSKTEKDGRTSLPDCHHLRHASLLSS
jgi:hypothetical protein